MTRRQTDYQNLTEARKNQLRRASLIYYHKNKEKLEPKRKEWRIKNQEYATIFVKLRRQNAKHRAIELLGNSCNRCHQTFIDCVYDFHHKDPTEKEGNLKFTKAWNQILLELAKCVLVCSNCHREIHEEIRQQQLCKEFPSDETE